MPLYSLNGETASIMTLAPVIPVLTVASVEDGVGQAKALVAGGLYAIEVTLRTPSALAAIREIAKSVPGAVVGAGTIVSVEQIDEAIAAGARFLVSPGASASARQGRSAIAGAVPAGLRDRVGGHGAQGARLSRAEALSRRSGRRREAARIASRAPARSQLLPDRRHRSREGARLSQAAECAVRRRIVDVAEGGARRAATTPKSRTLSRETARLARAPA